MSTPIKFLKYNANPYGRTSEDCVTRALVAGTRYGYKTIVDMIGAPFFPSMGAKGVPIKSIIDFEDEYHIIKNIDFEIKESYDITQRDMNNFYKYNGMTLEFWLSNMSKEDTDGWSNIIFIGKNELTDEIPNYNSSKFHAIWGNITTKQFADLIDSRGTIIFDMFAVDPSKMCPKDDERYFVTEEKRLKEEHQKYLDSLKKKRK